MDKKLRLGIIGAGNMGSKHLSNILAGKCPEIEVTAVADRDPAKFERVRWRRSTRHSLLFGGQ